MTEPDRTFDKDQPHALAHIFPSLSHTRLQGPQQYSEGITFWDYNDPSLSMPGSQGGAHGSGRRNRHGMDSVKHRRTRSGCYTCRSRRVKCDEARPVCERCRKGARECNYPDGNSSSKVQRNKIDESQGLALDDSISSDDENGAEDLSPVRKPGSDLGEGSQGSTEKKAKACSSKTSKGNGLSSDAIPEEGAAFGPIPSSWSHLPQDVQFYLGYHRHCLTVHHYFLKYERTDFVHGTLVDIALQHEPLLYAIVSFAAYNYTVANPNGRLQKFLGYYNKSLSLLRKSLQTSDQFQESTILTILQLSTFEEYLGDLTSLSSHHRAARRMISSMYSPESIMDTYLSRMIFAWYNRFDVLAGLVGGNETQLGREWYAVNEQYYTNQSQAPDTDVYTCVWALTARSRRLGLDMAGLLAKLSRGLIPIEDFLSQAQLITRDIEGMRLSLTELHDPEYSVVTYPNRKPLGPDDIVDPYTPNGLFSGPKWILNFAWIDYYAIVLMHKYHFSSVMQQPPGPDHEALALEICRIIEAIDRWPEALPGSTLSVHSGLAFAALFLPRDQRNSMWTRKKLARTEKEGYIFPATFRSKLAEVWQDPDVLNWWLPNCEELTPIISAIREFGAERIAQPMDSTVEDVRDLKAIFSRLNVDDSSSQKSSPSAGQADVSPPASQSPTTTHNVQRGQGSW